MKALIKRLMPICLSLCLGLCSLAAAAATIRAEANRDKITLSDTLSLTVTVDEQVAFSSPDFSELKQQFDIIDSRRSNQYRNINGKIISFTQWLLTLAPKQKGQLLVPSFQYQDSYSDAIAIEVIDQPQQSSNQDIFLQTEVDQTEVFVQQQIVYTQRLFTSVNLRSVDPQTLELDGSRVEKISENQYQTRRNGRLYHVVDISYAIYPQSSGQLTIPALRWNIMVSNGRRNVFDPFGSDPASLRRLSSHQKTVNVKSAPANSKPWLPAKNLQIKQSWSADLGTLTVGEPITRTIELTAEGLTASQLPNLSSTASLPGSLKVYPEQAKSSDKPGSNGITGHKIFTEALIAKQAGELKLAAIELRWWDTEAKQWRSTKLAELKLDVRPASVVPSTITNNNNTNAATTPAEPVLPQAQAQLDNDSGAPQSAGMGSWLLAVMALLSLALAALLVGLYLGLRKNHRKLQREMQQLIQQQRAQQQQRLQPKLAFEQLIIELEKAIQAGQKPECANLSQQILQQMKQSWPRRYAQQRQRAGDLNQTLEQLNQSLYGQGAASLELHNLVLLFRQLQHSLEVEADEQDPGLAPLNP